jgi:hypothetical protein
LFFFSDSSDLDERRKKEVKRYKKLKVKREAKSEDEDDERQMPAGRNRPSVKRNASPERQNKEKALLV